MSPQLKFSRVSTVFYWPRVFSLLCIYCGLCKTIGARKLTVCLSGFIFRARANHRFSPVTFGVSPSLAHHVTTYLLDRTWGEVPPSSFLLSAPASLPELSSPSTQGMPALSLWGRCTPLGHSPQATFPPRNFFLLEPALAWQALVVKNPPASEETQDMWGRSQSQDPLEKKMATWQPTPVFLPGKCHEQRSLVGCGPWGHKELGTAGHTHMHKINHVLERNGACFIWTWKSSLAKNEYLQWTLKNNPVF